MKFHFHRDITVIAVPGHVAYPRLITNEADDRWIVEWLLAHRRQHQAPVLEIPDANHGHRVVLEDQHIMGMVRDEGHNITHRKVCSTNQCDLVDVLIRNKTQFFFCVVVLLRTYNRHAHKHTHNVKCSFYFFTRSFFFFFLIFP